MFTLIIQGPTSTITKKIIDSALSESRIEKIVVSHWNTDTINIEPSDRISVVLSSNPHLNNTIGAAWNKFNLANQALTTKAAFENVNTPYVIKLRSNWPYLDFQKIVDKFLEEPHKILTSNLYFRHTVHHPFHCSDHLIVSTSEVIRKAFDSVYQRCLNKDIARSYYASGYYDNVYSPAVEQIICDELLRAKNVPERENASEIMKANFNIAIAEEISKGETLPVTSVQASRILPVVMNLEEI
jgi:hypothetical protein